MPRAAASIRMLTTCYLVIPFGQWLSGETRPRLPCLKTRGGALYGKAMTNSATFIEMGHRAWAGVAESRHWDSLPDLEAHDGSQAVGTEVLFLMQTRQNTTMYITTSDSTDGILDVNGVVIGARCKCVFVFSSVLSQSTKTYGADFNASDRVSYPTTFVNVADPFSGIPPTVIIRPDLQERSRCAE